MDSAHLIVGLGNPGTKYERTRHNVGFLALDRLADEWGGAWLEERKFRAKMSLVKMDDRNIYLCQPQTYMNVTGESVSAICDYYRIAIERVLVVVDDAELAFGRLRMRTKGSSGGHNGLNSVEKYLSTPEYHRLRIGIGRPAGEVEMSAYVLDKFSPHESEQLAQVLRKVLQQCECWLRSGPEQAMNEFNGQPDFPDEQTEKDST